MKISKKYLNKIIVEEVAFLLKENYNNFFPIEQEFFNNAPSYDQYILKLSKILPDDEDSRWLFNHHAAELAWEENKISQAKNHIQIAKKLNPFGNKITDVLDFIINMKGNKKDLKSFIEKNVLDPTEKKTAYELFNDLRYGGKIK